MRFARIIGIAALPLGLSPASAATVAVTATPYEALRQCIVDRWTGSGRLTAINNAAGAILNFEFDSVAANGRVATGHATFAIEDRGSERRVAASAANATDTALASQMLDETMTRCSVEAPHR